MARIGIPLLPRKLQQHVQDTYGASIAAPHYRGCYDAAVMNKIPAEFCNGRWTVAEGDLDAIARAMGLVPADPKSAARARAVDRVAA